MENWSETRLKDVCSIKGGKRLPNGHSLTAEVTNHPYIKARDIRNGKIITDNFEYLEESTFTKISRYIVNTNDVCITVVANIGDVGIVTNNLDGANLTENAVKLSVFDKKLNPHFLNHLLSSKYYKDYMSLLASGTAQSKLGIYKIEKIQIQFPELFLQQQIVEILSAYDDLIETNNQRIATMEQLAQQIYKEWFVRMRFPGWEHTPVNHGIPEGWKIENFDKFCMLQRGFDLPDQDIKEGQYPVIASTTIKAYHNKYKVDPPVITTGRSGSLGTVLFSHQKSWPLNTALFVKKFYGNNPYLVFYTLKSLKLENFNAGAGVPSLNRNHLQAIKIKVPSKDIQNQFDKLISAIFNQKIVLEESNSILQQTRNLLLPRLISGKLSIKQAEALAP